MEEKKGSKNHRDAWDQKGRTKTYRRYGQKENNVHQQELSEEE